MKTDEFTVELRTLCARRTDVAADRNRAINRLRAQLRTALTQLILAGLKAPEIKALINEELDELSQNQMQKAQSSLR